MHLEAVEPEVRERIMPGKATVPIAYYLEAFAAAVKVFGRGQVSTYLLAGLGDRQAALVEMSERLIQIGVYPIHCAIRAHYGHTPSPTSCPQ